MLRMAVRTDTPEYIAVGDVHDVLVTFLRRNIKDPNTLKRHIVH
jgi:hypothetical protein